MVYSIGCVSGGIAEVLVGLIAIDIVAPGDKARKHYCEQHKQSPPAVRQKFVLLSGLPCHRVIECVDFYGG